jgi:hypothetical protein
MYNEYHTIFGEPGAGLEQVRDFILAREHGEYTRYDIAEVILPAYFAQAHAVGIDPILAIAQMIHETGNLTSFWSQRPQRNPAGIGVTGQRQADQPVEAAGWAYNTQRGQWERGISFASWVHDSIPAQLGRLLAYTLPNQTGDARQQALIERALSYRPFPSSFRGSATNLKQLGRVHNPLGAKGCGWASPGDHYGEQIARIANALAATG